MGSTLTDKEIEDLRRWAKAAEPYSYDHEVFQVYDGPPRTQEEQARVNATMAKWALEKEGVSLEKPEK